MDTPKLHADGFIFAYNAYIERNNESKLAYCDSNEALAYDHNSRLYLKAQNLASKGHDKVVEILFSAAEKIKNILQSNSPNKYESIQTTLETTQTDPEVKKHRGVKQLFVNFLLMLSGIGAVYLATTAEKRGSFWYRPNTDTEKTLGEFQNQIKPPK